MKDFLKSLYYYSLGRLIIPIVLFRKVFLEENIILILPRSLKCKITGDTSAGMMLVSTHYHTVRVHMAIAAMASSWILSSF